MRAPGTPREILESEEALPAAALVAEPTAGERIEGIEYPEWDYRLAAYRHPGAIVRPVMAAPGDAAWVDRVLERHRALVRGVRRRFDGLRPRRRVLGRQLDGDDIDLLACVEAFADRRAGAPSDDRLYSASRPGRRDLAIAVLVDVSASTDAWVSAGLRIVDVEKEALVVLLEALDVLGDRHAVLAFSGQGPDAVRVATVKGFDEGPGRARAASPRSSRTATRESAPRSATPAPSSGRSARAIGCSCCYPTASRTTSTSTGGATGSRTPGRRWARHACRGWCRSA